MPTYEYKCEACGHHEEVFAKMSDPPPAACEQCGAVELVKVLFPVAVHYKGSGFYSTDYAGKAGAAASSDSSGASSDASSSSTSEGSTTSSSDTPSTPATAASDSSSSSSGTGSSSSE